MFYCDECAKRNNWPINTPTRSYGTCEICDLQADCNNLPERQLPAPKTDPNAA